MEVNDYLKIIHYQKFNLHYMIKQSILFKVIQSKIIRNYIDTLFCNLKISYCNFAFNADF